MIIASIYSSEDAGTAFVRLRIEGEEIRLLEVWNPQGADESLFTAIKRTEINICLFNGFLVSGERHSSLAELAKSKSISGVEVAIPFSASEGMHFFWDAQARQAFNPSACKGWNKLATRLERVETRKTAQPMALLQGLIAADREMKRDTGSPLFGYEQLPSFIPGQDSQTPYGIFRGSPYRGQPPI